MTGIPVLRVEADCIARAWEESLILLHRKGCDLKTQYDKADDPPSKDATMMITITEPLKDPMIGLHDSFGVMVNYRYIPAELEENHERFVASGAMRVSSSLAHEQRIAAESWRREAGKPAKRSHPAG